MVLQIQDPTSVSSERTYGSAITYNHLLSRIPGVAGMNIVPETSKLTEIII